jgi:ferredoxin
MSIDCFEQPASRTGGLKPTAADLPPSLAALWRALRTGRFFKLIGGGSFTETARIAALTRAYAAAGADCIDIAPEPAVVEAVAATLATLPPPYPAVMVSLPLDPDPHFRKIELDEPDCIDIAPEPAVVEAVAATLATLPLSHPAVMVSLPLDPDPHFRKIELDEPDCIRCGLCLPVCPTEALTLPDALAISQALCYGCGRCVPVCPTDALSLLPFQVEAQVESVLQHPIVQAVEIHSRYVDPYMLETFWTRWRDDLQNKLISLCFRPGDIPARQILAFIETAERLSPLPILLQIDGAPMSGNDTPEASHPTLEAACAVRSMLEAAGRTEASMPPITISGGINEYTARLLREPRYAFIAGVGMGTVARQKVWSLSSEAAVLAAEEMVFKFKRS